jgi:hypothetical protein
MQIHISTNEHKISNEFRQLMIRKNIDVWYKLNNIGEHMEHKLINGIKVPLTAEEIAQRQADELAWNAGAFDRAMNDLRSKRNSLLSATDYLALSDNTMTEEVKTYRQALRDITEGLTTKEQVEAVVFPTKF